MIKQCKGCNKLLDSSEFYSVKMNKDGLRGKCKKCTCIDTNKYCKSNPEKYKAYSKTRRAENASDVRAAKNAYYKKNRDKLLKQDKASRERNKEAYLSRERKWYKNRTDEQVLAKKKYRKEYIKKNAPAFRAYAATKKAIKIQTKPLWANNEYIKLFYVLAKIEENRVGEKVHVDHIIPLNGKNVCGLHCEDNLQLLTAKDNLQKYNKFQDGRHC